MARRYGASGRGGRKRSAAELKADNAGVKDGTIRKGRGGKTVRKYNATTGRWDVLQVVDKGGRTQRTRTLETSRPPTPDTSPTSTPGTSRRYKVATATKRTGPQFGSGKTSKPSLGNKGSSYDSRKSLGSRGSIAASKARTVRKVEREQDKKLNPGAPRKGDKKIVGPTKQVYDGSKWVRYATKTGGSKQWKPTAYGKKYPHLMRG